MTTMLTVTQKGQFTLSKQFLTHMGIKAGDKVTIRLEGKKAIIEPAGRGLLDKIGSLGPLKVPKGKTLSDLIHDAHQEGIGHDLR